MADQSGDGVKPWTIKGIPPEERNAAIAAAQRDDQTLGEWMARAIRSHIQSDRQQDRAPALVGPEIQPRADLAEIERTIAAVHQLAAAAGEPPPKTVTRSAYALLRMQLAGLRGPGARPPRSVRPIPGQTGTDASPTIAPDGRTDEGVRSAPRNARSDHRWRSYRRRGKSDRSGLLVRPSGGVVGPQSRPYDG